MSETMSRMTNDWLTGSLAFAFRGHAPAKLSRDTLVPVPGPVDATTDVMYNSPGLRPLTRQ